LMRVMAMSFPRLAGYQEYLAVLVFFFLVVS